MDKDLLAKYNHPTPRYTSYPPANFFNESYTEKEYLDALVRSNEWEPKTISFYFHIPFCKKMCFYCGCNSCPMSDNTTVLNYVEAIIKEIKMVGQYLDKSRLVSQVHFGGGTPNAIPDDYLSRIMDELYSTFTFKPTAEIAIECNPAYLDNQYMQQLKSTGFNRFSLGIQDFDPQVLKGVNRDGSVIPVEELVAFLKDGNPNIKVNLDFIYGLPYQTAEGFLKTIQKAISIKPDRLVTFSYAHVPWVNKNQEILEKRGLPSNDEKTRMYELASQQLIESGYKAVGLDHFVQADDELYLALENGALHRNFQGYCTRNTTGQVYAFGVSGISQLQQVYAQNTKSVTDYITAINSNQLPIIKGYHLNEQEIVVREIITELMCNRQVVWSRLASLFESSVEEIKKVGNYNEKMLAQFAEDGIITCTNEGIHVTDEGLLFIRNVAASFDPLVATSKQQFSKPV